MHTGSNDARMRRQTSPHAMAPGSGSGTASRPSSSHALTAPITTAPLPLQSPEHSQVVASLVSDSGTKVAKSSSSLSMHHPYSSLSFSPCRQYAALACKDTLQIVSVQATGLHVVLAVPTAPYFQSTSGNSSNSASGNAAATSTSTLLSGNSRSSNTHDTGLLNLRDFALGGGVGRAVGSSGGAGGGAAAAGTGANQSGGGGGGGMNVVLTDVAWSRGHVKKSRKANRQKRQSESDDDGTIQSGDGYHVDANNSNDGDLNDEDQDYDDEMDLDYSAWTTDDGGLDDGAMAMAAESARQRYELQTSFIAAAGSNGVIVVWSAAAMLSGTTAATVQQPSSATSSASASHNHKNQKANRHTSASTSMSSKHVKSSVVVQPEAELRQHTRQVNRLAWHAQKYGLLLSASQDGTVVLWERSRRRQQPSNSSSSPRHGTDASSSMGMNVDMSIASTKNNRFRGLFGGFTTAATVQQQQQQHQQQSTRPLQKLQQPQQQHQFQWQCRSTYTPKSEAVRDIRWSPFYDDVFALVTTSGSLIVYNQFIAARAVVKITAHSGDASTLDWHPSRPHLIATGGANDRSVKIWDLSDDLSVLSSSSTTGSHHTAFSAARRDDANLERNANTSTSKGESVGTNESSGTATNDNSGASATIGATTALTPLSYTTRTLSSMSSIGFSHSSRHRGAAKRMLHALAISASVTRLRWRPPSNEKLILEEEDRHDAMMAVATAPIKGASAGGCGVLALWSYYRPYMPLSVLEGHQDGAVTDFDWLDTPQPTRPPQQPQEPMDQATSKRWDAPRRSNRKGRALSLSEENSTSRLPGATSHEVDSILYDNSEREDDFDKPIGIWQHVLSVGRDGRCLVQSFARGDRPIRRVPSSCFAMANLSPFQKGCGSLQLFSICQDIPSGVESDFLLTGLRRDGVTATAPGMFREIPTARDAGQIITFPVGWRAGRRLPETPPRIVFNVIDQGDLDESLNPVEDDRGDCIVVAPEVVHLSRFASRYKLYLDDECPSRVGLCLHNADVADLLSQSSLAHMWRIVAFLLDGTGIDGLPGGNASNQQQNMMQFVVPSTIKALLEERATAGDVQTCVALCEVLEVVKPDQSVRLPDLEVDLIREWYLSYIDILRDMCLFSHATFLIRSCKDPYIGSLHQQSTTIHESCPHCGKALLPEDGPSRDQESSFARRACKSCRRRVGLCFLCHEPVKGVYVWCPGCGTCLSSEYLPVPNLNQHSSCYHQGHGGHLEHSLQWFGGMGGSTVREMCPTGCGHKCNSLKELSAFPKTESFHERQFDAGLDFW